MTPAAEQDAPSVHGADLVGAGEAADRLLSLLVGIRGRREAAAATLPALLREVEVDRFYDRLAQHRLLPLLGARLSDLAGDAVSADQAARALRSLQDARQRSLALELVTLRIVLALRADGVRVAILKGPFFARELHGDPGARVSNDVDLLVEPGDFRRAITALAGAGYTPANGHGAGDALPLFETALRSSSGGPAIDLHWRVHWDEHEFSRQALARAEKDPAAGALRLQPHDALVTLLLGYARDGFWGLRPLADIAAWWDVYGDALEPAGLLPVIDADPDVGPCLRASAHVASRFGGLPLERLLPARAALSRSEALACELAGWDEDTTLVQFRATCALVDMLLAPPGGRPAAIARYYAPPLSTVPRGRGRTTASSGPVTRLVERLRYAARVAQRYGPHELRLLAGAHRSLRRRCAAEASAGTERGAGRAVWTCRSRRIQRPGGELTGTGKPGPPEC